MEQRHVQRTRPVARAIAAAALWLVLHDPVAAQGCNPVIDGTYCTTPLPRGGSAYTSSGAGPVINPVGDFGRSITIGQDTPGTFAGISSNSGGTQCIGLLRRGNCR